MVRSLGAENALILSQVLAEYNFAYNNRLCLGNDFLFSPHRMASYTGMSEDRLIAVLKKLEELGFINFFNSDIEDILYIRVHEKNILIFKKNEELKNYYGNWDDGLKSSQNPIHKETHFCNSMAEIKVFLDNHLLKTETIPLIAYLYINNMIMNFEKHTGISVLEIQNLKEELFFITQSAIPLANFIGFFAEKLSIENLKSTSR